MPQKTPYVPVLGKNVYIDPSAQVIGRVRIGEGSSIWPGAVLRGDIHRITVGRYSNIQDLSLVHVETDRDCRIGNFVTIGHQVTLHACTVQDGALVGIGSIVLDGAVIGRGSILGAGSLVTHDQKLKPESLYFGRPAKWIRRLSKKEVQGLKKWALRYVRYAENHRRGLYLRVRPGGVES